MILLAAEQQEMVVKPWALIPLGVLSLGFAYLYYQIFKFGMDKMKQFIAAREAEYHILIQFRR